MGNNDQNTLATVNIPMEALYYTILRFTTYIILSYTINNMYHTLYTMYSKQVKGGKARLGTFMSIDDTTQR